jgi:UDP-N-acetyl-D-galactosamine dehydrogenase
MLRLRNCRIGVVGLGYVGLPLAIEFGKHFVTIGFDIKRERISELRAGRDSTLEIDKDDFRAADKLKFTFQVQDLKRCTVFVVTVPTPIDEYKRPDLTPLVRKRNCREGVEKGRRRHLWIDRISGLYGRNLRTDTRARVWSKIQPGFLCGLQPGTYQSGRQRAQADDHPQGQSGSSADAAKFVDKLYASIITAGTYRASSIRVAEAAKVIENTQRDVNIALINELALIFKRLGIDTEEVLRAAGTKWNFLPFHPGLVGGHCIGVDPYYLTHKAQEIGYHPEMILPDGGSTTPWVCTWRSKSSNW